MTFMVFTARDAMWQFFNRHLALSWTNDFRAIGWVPMERHGEVMKMDDISVAVAYNNFIGYTCCIHTVIQRPEHVTPHMVRETFRYPFVELGMKVAFGLVDSYNQKALDLDLRLGFKELDRFEKAGLEGDLVLLAMKKEDCRWIRKERHGQEIRATPA